MILHDEALNFFVLRELKRLKKILTQGLISIIIYQNEKEGVMKSDYEDLDDDSPEELAVYDNDFEDGLFKDGFDFEKDDEFEYDDEEDDEF